MGFGVLVAFGCRNGCTFASSLVLKKGSRGDLLEYAVGNLQDWAALRVPTGLMVRPGNCKVRILPQRWKACFLVLPHRPV